MERIICTRCGREGHRASSCPLPVPAVVPPALGRAEDRIHEALAALDRYQARRPPVSSITFDVPPPPRPLKIERVLDWVFAVTLGLIGGLALAKHWPW